MIAKEQRLFGAVATVHVVRVPWHDPVILTLVMKERFTVAYYMLRSWVPYVHITLLKTDIGARIAICFNFIKSTVKYSQLRFIMAIFSVDQCCRTLVCLDASAVRTLLNGENHL